MGMVGHNVSSNPFGGNCVTQDGQKSAGNQPQKCSLARSLWHECR